MASTKTQTEAQDTTPAAPVVAQQPETPEKLGVPQQVARTATASALPPPNGAPSEVRGAEMLANGNKGAGAGAGPRAQMMTALQRSVGNSRVSTLLGSSIQTKLSVGAVDDPHEKEADRVAETVTQQGNNPQSAVQRQIVMRHSLTHLADTHRQTRKEAEPEADKKAVRVSRLPAEAESNGNEPQVGHEPAGPVREGPSPSEDAKPAAGEQTGMVQRAAGPGAGPGSTEGDLEGRINAPSGGQSLPEGLQREMEAGMGADFSNVRVHNSTTDQADASRLSAKAFTHGEHIWLGAGESASDRKLMAHELTHVVQQGGGEVRRKPTPSDGDDPALENENALIPDSVAATGPKDRAEPGHRTSESEPSNPVDEQLRGDVSAESRPTATGTAGLPTLDKPNQHSEAPENSGAELSPSAPASPPSPAPNRPAEQQSSMKAVAVSEPQSPPQVNGTEPSEANTPEVTTTTTTSPAAAEAASQPANDLEQTPPTSLVAPTMPADEGAPDVPAGSDVETSLESVTQPAETESANTDLTASTSMPVVPMSSGAAVGQIGAGPIQRQEDDGDDGILASIRRRIRGIADGLRSGWTSLSQMATNALQSVRETLNGMIDGLMALVMNGLRSLQSALTGLMGRVTQLVNGFKRMVEGALGSVIGVVQGIGHAIMRLDANALRAAWNRLLGIFSGVNQRVQQAMQAVSASINGLWQGLRSRFNELVASVTSTATGLMSRAQTMVQGVRQGLTSAWESLRNRAGQLSGVLGGILDRLRSLISSLLSWAEGIWNGIQQQWSSLANRVGGFLQQMRQRLGSVWQGLRQRAAGVWQWITAQWTALRQRAANAMGQFANGLRSFWARFRSFAITPLIEKIAAIGRFVRLVEQAVANPDELMTPYVDAIAGKVDGEMPARAMAIGRERLQEQAGGRQAGPAATAQTEEQATTQTGGAPAIQRQPVSGVVQRDERSTASFAEVWDGFKRHIVHKWSQLHIWQMVKDMLWSLIWPWPAIGDELSGLWTDLKNAVGSLFSPRSPLSDFWGFLHDLWSNFLHLLDIPLALFRRLTNIAMLLMGWVTIALVIIGAIGGTFAGAVIGGILSALASLGIATGAGGAAGGAAGGFTGAGAGFGAAMAIGEALFIAFLAIQGATLVKTLVTVLTARQKPDEKERDYSQLADTLIGLGVAAVLFLIGWIASRLASFIMDALARLPRLRGPIEQLRAGFESTRGAPPENTQQNPSNSTFGTDSEAHVQGHGHAADGQPPQLDARATQRAGTPTFKSKFAIGEGGQAFTNEIMNHPSANRVVQSNGRTVYTVNDLGRITGTGQHLEPVRGGTVVVEGPTPHPRSSTAPNHVVTQFPSGAPSGPTAPRNVPILPPVVNDQENEE